MCVDTRRYTDVPKHPRHTRVRRRERARCVSEQRTTRVYPDAGAAVITGRAWPQQQSVRGNPNGTVDATAELRSSGATRATSVQHGPGALPPEHENTHLQHPVHFAGSALQQHTRQHGAEPRAETATHSQENTHYDSALCPRDQHDAVAWLESAETQL